MTTRAADPETARPPVPWAPESSAVVTADDISFAYRQTPVLKGVSFALKTGEFVALAGPNGSGKSTLVRILLGVLPAQTGRVEVLGETPTELRRWWRIGYVPQRPVVNDLLPATMGDVVGAGRVARRGWWRRPGSADQAAVDAALEAVALTRLRHRRLAELSGGQQQRTFIAKALATEPQVLVLDEPRAGVDADSQVLLRNALVAACAFGAAAARTWALAPGGTIVLVAACAFALAAIPRSGRPEPRTAPMPWRNGGLVNVGAAEAMAMPAPRPPDEASTAQKRGRPSAFMDRSAPMPSHRPERRAFLRSCGRRIALRSGGRRGE